METLGIRNKNPFNLRSNNVAWLGKIGENKGFCVFESLDLGLRAGFINLCTQLRRYTDIKSLVSHYAPSFENDTNSYIDYIIGSMTVLQINYESCRTELEPYILLSSCFTYYESRFTLLFDKALEVVGRYHIFDKHLALLKQKRTLT